MKRFWWGTIKYNLNSSHTGFLEYKTILINRSIICKVLHLNPDTDESFDIKGFFVNDRLKDICAKTLAAVMNATTTITIYQSFHEFRIIRSKYASLSIEADTPL